MTGGQQQQQQQQKWWLVSLLLLCTTLQAERDTAVLDTVPQQSTQAMIFNKEFG
jgi:hypothetical protein